MLINSYFCKLKTKKNTMESAKKLSELNNNLKPVSTQLLFQPKEGKVISLQILKNQELAEHTTKIPALLVCVKGHAIYSEENSRKISPRTSPAKRRNSTTAITALTFPDEKSGANRNFTHPPSVRRETGWIQ